MIDVIIPTFQRYGVLDGVVKNVHDNTELDHKIYFVVEPGETKSMEEIRSLDEDLIISDYPGNHTGAANTAYKKTNGEFFIVANDDFNFHKGWDIEALKKMMDGIGVVGLNDGSGSGVYTAITLVRREYIKKHSGCVDIENTLYYPGYNHNYVDTEFSNTAKMRGMWAEAPLSIVEHLHWSFNKAKKDKTYQKSCDTASLDEVTYNNRKHLFLC